MITPSEPPSGAFLLAAGLRARGIEAGFLDLSLAFFRHIFGSAPSGRGMPDVASALRYLEENEAYTPQGHRTASGTLNSAMGNFSRLFPGWRLTLMDASPPVPVHDPHGVAVLCEGGETPFKGFWNEYLLPVLERHKPSRVFISISYLSQLAAGIELAGYLRTRGFDFLVGGSLPNSLSRTGNGFRLLKEVIPETVTGDGSEVLGAESRERMLDRLDWPLMIRDWDYISGRPVIPFALTTGCYWNRCLFCPDSDWQLEVFGEEVLSRFLDTVPSELMERRPILHFIDSAVPPGPLRRALPFLEERGLDFYTFARPEPWLPGMARDLSSAGCLMLQMGVESGSRTLLDRYCKGIDPDDSLRALRSCAEEGIRTYAYMLLGLPGESEEDIGSSLELLTKAGDSLDFINLSIFNLPEHCRLVSMAAEFGIELLDPPESEDCIRLYRPFLYRGRNPRVPARRRIADGFSSIPSVARALRRTPRWFRTSHFPMMQVDGRRS
ncbi:MAG: hypothetical protein AVO35_12665 [Candidatus Aegiribacteria sp. MLS_C]|nr:MAG: hypothetical protein AVO35_12665 [Candidatus Aegiribacteria sp. MLS_C]